MNLTIQIPDRLQAEFEQRARERYGEAGSVRAPQEAIALWLETVTKPDDLKAECALNNQVHQDIFAIGIRLKTPGGQFHAGTEEPVELDTGYGGDVLLPWEMYVDLELYGWECPKEHWSVGLSVPGEKFKIPERDQWPTSPSPS
jgi:hypothetical protein